MRMHDADEAEPLRSGPSREDAASSVRNRALVTGTSMVPRPGTVPSRHGGRGHQESGDSVRVRSAWRRASRTVGAVSAAALLAGAFLTHFAVGSDPLDAEDKALMGMERMGPPPGLQDAYSELNADTAAIRSSSAGPVIAAGIFTGTFANPVPGSGVKHLIETLNTPEKFAVFVSPLNRIRSLRVFVDYGGQRLPGSVILTDQQLGLAAIKVPMESDQLSTLIGPPPFLGPPGGVLRIPRLILRLIPGENGSTGYVLTSGLLSRFGKSLCDAPVSASEAGAPFAAVSNHGSLTVVGLAVPSSERGRCSILGGWAVNEFMRLVTLSPEGDRTGAYLGVLGETIVYRGVALGVHITSVELDSAAARAGLQPGDVVIGIDGRVTGSLTALADVLHRLQPGTWHTVTYLSHGRLHRVPVILSGYPG